MNFKKVLLALVAIGALLVSSCRINDDGAIVPVNIAVSQDYLELDSTAGTYSVKLFSNTPWKGEIVVSNPYKDEAEKFEASPWITVTAPDPLEGVASEDSLEVTFSVTENSGVGLSEKDTLFQREVIIYFRSDRQIYATLTVHQMGGVLKPNADTGPKPVTVEEFLAASESNQWYRLSGKITGLNTSNDYGNFTLEDATGATVYVYGLNLNETAADKTFPQIGVGEGDYVTIVARRGSFNGSPQANDAYYAPVKVTVAEFLAAPIDEDGQLYEITGTMKGLSNETYGNFDITDETGSVYVYGLTSTPILGQSNDKSFSQTGYAEGDKLTIVGTRGDYNGKAEVMGPAYPVRLKTGGSEPEPEPEPQPELTKATVAEVLAAEVSDDVWYELTGTITEIQNAEYGNIVIEDETGSILVYGLTKEWNGGSNDKSFSEIEGLTAGDIVTLGGTRDEYGDKPQIGGTAFYISHVDGEAPEVDIKVATIEEFLAAEESDQWYRLSGKITNLQEGPYGNFDLVDADNNSVYVYGLKVTSDAGNQTFAETGLQEGDYVTLIGKRSSFNGKPQVGSAYYAALIVTVDEFLAAEPNDDQLYHLVGTIQNLEPGVYGNFDLVDESGKSVYVYGLTSTPKLGQSNDKSFPQLGLGDGDTVILVGVRDEYNGTPQVNGPAYCVRAKAE